MRAPTLIVAILLTAATVTAQAPPDFSGKWIFDSRKTIQPGPDGRVVLAAMLGDEVSIQQTATTLSLVITAGGQPVNAEYKLDGSESRNVSPALGGRSDVVVVSRATWVDGTLVITSKSESVDRGVRVNVETKRVLSLDASGDLIIERTGTPAAVVTPSRSVYRKAPSTGK